MGSPQAYICTQLKESDLLNYQFNCAHTTIQCNQNYGYYGKLLSRQAYWKTGQTCYKMLVAGTSCTQLTPLFYPLVLFMVQVGALFLGVYPCYLFKDLHFLKILQQTGARPKSDSVLMIQIMSKAVCYTLLST